jgi:hypothetical protein
MSGIARSYSQSPSNKHAHHDSAREHKYPPTTNLQADHSGSGLVLVVSK